MDLPSKLLYHVRTPFKSYCIITEERPVAEHRNCGKLTSLWPRYELDRAPLYFQHLHDSEGEDTEKEHLMFKQIRAHEVFYGVQCFNPITTQPPGEDLHLLKHHRGTALRGITSQIPGYPTQSALNHQISS